MSEGARLDHSDYAHVRIGVVLLPDPFEISTGIVRPIAFDRDEPLNDLEAHALRPR